MLITLKRDIRPPTAPVLGTPVVLGTSSIQIPLATAASDVNGIASYSLEYATSLLGTYLEATSAAVFPQTVTGLSASTQYFFRAKAVDNFGNHGPYSGIVSATTQVPAPADGLTWPAHAPAYVSLIPEVGGYGMNSVAGSGRHLGTPVTTVILVNSLASGSTGGAVSGYGANVFAGTWEYAWRHSASPKVIIPIISGWVTIQDSINCQNAARTGYVSYYGQFAPGQGLYLRGCNVETGGASNVAVWHLRSYMGDDVTGLPAGNRDCFSSGYGQGVTQQIVLINCEFAWSIDEVAGFFRSHNQLTLVNNAFFEPLHISTIIHPEDGAGFDHGFGPQIGGDTGQPQTSAVSSFRNLWAHTTGRNPLITAQTFVHANNLHYNHGRPTGGQGSGVQIVPHGATEANYANIIGNGFVRGPNNNNSLVAVAVTGTFPSGSGAYLLANSQFGWTAPASQNAFLTTSPSGYAVSAVLPSAYPSSWGTGLTGVLQWAANPLAPTLTEWSNFVTLMDQTVGAQPLRRTAGRLKLVFDQIRDRLAGVTQTSQFVNTVDGAVSAGGWFSVPSVTVDPLNPGSEWHGPLPTGADRDTPYTTGTFSDGKPRVGYTRLEEFAYEQHLYVTTEQPVVSTGEYDFIDAPVGYTDHWVSPTRTSNGSGNSQADPMQWSQMMSFNPAGGRHRFIVMPGQLSVTGNIPDDTKMPYLQPSFSGTAANPVIVKAQYPATNSATTGGQYSVIRRTANIGSILGTEGGASYWRFDGFKFAGGNGSAGSDGGNEKAAVVLRSTEGWWFSRCHFDGEEADWTSIGSTNGGCFFMQLVSDCVIQDCLIENYGDWGNGSDIWQGIELYDATDNIFRRCTIRNIWGLGFHMKGAPAVAFQRNQIYDMYIENCNEAGISAFDVVAGTNPANHNNWHNIIVKDCFHGMVFNANSPHQGTHLQNCTFIDCPEQIMFTLGIGHPGYTQYISVRNCVVYSGGIALMWLDGFHDPDPVFTNNRYNGNTTFMNSGAGNTTLATWQGPTFGSRDAGSDSNVPVFTNSGAGNYTTATSVTADAPDTGGFFGGGTIRRGALMRDGVAPGYRNNV